MVEIGFKRNNLNPESVIMYLFMVDLVLVTSREKITQLLHVTNKLYLLYFGFFLIFFFSQNNDATHARTRKNVSQFNSREEIQEILYERHVYSALSR